jgi:hypothetical protein
MVSGLANLVGGSRLRARIDAEAAIVLWGLIQFLVGAWIAASPLLYEVLTVTAGLATFTIIAGISLSVFGFRMKWMRGGGGGSSPMSGGSRRRVG